MGASQDEQLFEGFGIVTRRRNAPRWSRRRLLSVRTLEGSVVLTQTRIEFRRATRFDRLLWGIRTLGEQHAVELREIDEAGLSTSDGVSQLTTEAHRYEIGFLTRGGRIRLGRFDRDSAERFQIALSNAVRRAHENR